MNVRVCARIYRVTQKNDTIERKKAITPYLITIYRFLYYNENSTIVERYRTKKRKNEKTKKRRNEEKR